MLKFEHKSISHGLLSVAAGLNPLTSTTFLLAVAVTASAALIWFQHSDETGHTFPIYGTIAGSYAGGFLVGRIFRRILKTAVIVVALALGGLGLLNRAHINTSKAQQTVKASSTWLEERSARAQDFLRHLLPSGAAGGAGAIAGGRRQRART